MSVTGRTQCPECLDSGHDNLILYDKGGSHCFACGYHNNTYVEGAGVTTQINAPISPIIYGRCADLPTRALNKAICTKYGYQVGQYTGSVGGEMVTDEVVHIANYYETANGMPVAQKLRTKNKKMKVLGNAKAMTLYGQWLHEPNPNKDVIVTEGELDALTVALALGSTSVVVSLPNGTGGAMRALKQHMEWLIGFRAVIIAFDSDTAGDKAQAECIELFDPSKVKVIDWPGKDPNELWVNNKGAELVEAVKAAKSLRPAAIIQAEDIMDDILTPPEWGLSWPWPALTGPTYGIHLGKIYTLGGGSGCGKTEIIIHIMEHLINKQGCRVGGLFLETTPKEIYLRLAGLQLGTRLHIPGTKWDTEQVRASLSSLNDKVYLYSVAKAGVRGSEWSAIKSKIIYMVKGLGLKYIILDHLTALCCHMKDERKELDSCMAELGALVISLNCSIFLVSHLRAPTDGGKSFEEGRVVTPSHFRGSQSIQYWSALMMGIERNKMSPDDDIRTKIIVRLIKDRFSGDAEGLQVHLQYIRQCGRLEESHTGVLV